MNLTDGAKHFMDLIERVKTRVNQNNFPCKEKRRMWKIPLNNVWTKYVMVIFF